MTSGQQITIALLTIIAVVSGCSLIASAFARLEKIEQDIQKIADFEKSLAP